jgi:hypothetical protein
VSEPARTAAAPAPADTPGLLHPLQELPLPAPVSWAPQTIGWVGVAAVLVLALLGVAWAVWRRHVKRRYRRVALMQLARLEVELQDPAQRIAALAAIPPLIKRASLAAAPRERVAALTGDAWLAFLARTHRGFDARSGALLTLVSYAPSARIAAVSEREAAALVAAARDWIEHHHVEI